MDCACKECKRMRVTCHAKEQRGAHLADRKLNFGSMDPGAQATNDAMH